MVKFDLPSSPDSDPLARRVKELEELLRAREVGSAESQPHALPDGFTHRYQIDNTWVPGSTVIGGPNRNVTITIRGAEIIFDTKYP